MAVLAATGLVTVALALGLRDLRVIIDPNNFLPPSYPNVVATHTVERVFGSKCGSQDSPGALFQRAQAADRARVHVKRGEYAGLDATLPS